MLIRLFSWSWKTKRLLPWIPSRIHHLQQHNSSSPEAPKQWRACPPELCGELAMVPARTGMNAWLEEQKENQGVSSGSLHWIASNTIRLLDKLIYWWLMQGYTHYNSFDSLDTSMHQSFHPSVHPRIYLSIYLPVYLSVYFCLSLCLAFKYLSDLLIKSIWSISRTALCIGL